MSSSAAFSRKPLPELVWFQEGPGLRNWQWADEGIKVINGTNIRADDHFDPSNTDKMVAWAEFDQKYKHFEINEGDIVVSSSGTIGKVARLTSEHLPMMMNTSVIRFRPIDEDQLDAGYLYAWLRSRSFKDQAEAYAHGAAQRNFGPSHLRLMKIDTPELASQRRIAAIVSAYDDLTQLNRRRIAVLEKMTRALFEEWFVRFRFPGYEAVPIEETAEGQLPQGWTWTTFGSLAPEVRSTVAPDTVPPDTPYVGLEHLPRRSVTLRDHGSAGDIGSLKACFSHGDILFGKIRPYFHKVVWAPFEGVCSTDAIVWRPGPGLAAQALAVASSDAFVRVAVQTSNGTKMPRANPSILAGYRCAMAPADISNVFEGIAGPAVRLAAELAAANHCLAASRDLLLPRLISGHLSVEVAERQVEEAA